MPDNNNVGINLYRDDGVLVIPELIHHSGLAEVQMTFLTQETSLCVGLISSTSLFDPR